jgi:hypothetical protein
MTSVSTSIFDKSARKSVPRVGMHATAAVAEAAVATFQLAWTYGMLFPPEVPSAGRVGRSKCPRCMHIVIGRIARSNPVNRIVVQSPAVPCRQELAREAPARWRREVTSSFRNTLRR